MTYFRDRDGILAQGASWNRGTEGMVMSEMWRCREVEVWIDVTAEWLKCQVSRPLILQTRKIYFQVGLHSLCRNQTLHLTDHLESGNWPVAATPEGNVCCVASANDDGLW